MNAVKNCLVVLAAAVALASCSADPTKDQAGKDLTLTVTPGTINTRVGDTVEVFASALDPLGGAANGTFTLSGNTGANFSAAIDSSYTPVYAGDRPQARTRIVVIALQTANDSFGVSGTGGAATVRVRIAPDSADARVTFTSTAVALGNADTATAPAGIRFTHGTAVSFSSPGASDTKVIGMSSDSTQVYFIPPPNAHGKVTFTGMANIQTPTLKYTATSTGTDTVAAAFLDSFPATHSSATLAIGQIDTITAGAGWTFTASSAPTNGVMSALVLGFSADSSQMYVIPAASHDGPNTPLTITNLKFDLYPGFLMNSFATSGNVTVPAAQDLGPDGGANPLTAGIFQYTLPAGQQTAIFFDSLTFGASASAGSGIQFAPIGDGAEQWYKITFTDAGPFTITVNWTTGDDLDFFVFLQNSGGTAASFQSQDGASTSQPEVDASNTAAANSTWLIDVTNSSGNVAGWGSVQIDR